MKLALIERKSANSKLAHQRLQFYVDSSGRHHWRPVPMAPYVAMTMISIAWTCPPTCSWKGSPAVRRGCYAQSGFEQFAVRKLDRASVPPTTLDKIIAVEVEAIDRCNPVDERGNSIALRLHVAGDVRTAKQAGMLARAAQRWVDRGGGPVWTYTHSWRAIPRRAWGVISVLASVDRNTPDRAVLHVG